MVSVIAKFMGGKGGRTDNIVYINSNNIIIVVWVATEND